MGNKTMNFGQGLKRARKKAGYKTQELFASSVQRSIDTVRNWEQGKNKPSLDDFLSLCDFFACDADYLLNNLDVQSHDLDFVCSYTGLSEDAVKKLHDIACSPDHDTLSLDYFSDFISAFYGRFLHKLLLLEQAVSLAEESLNGNGETDPGGKIEYVYLRQVLFDFSEFCRKIPEELFNSNKIYEVLERKVSYMPVNVSEADALEFIKKGLV